MKETYCHKKTLKFKTKFSASPPGSITFKASRKNKEEKKKTKPQNQKATDGKEKHFTHIISVSDNTFAIVYVWTILGHSPAKQVFNGYENSLSSSDFERNKISTIQNLKFPKRVCGEDPGFEEDTGRTSYKGGLLTNKKESWHVSKKNFVREKRNAKS